MSRALIVLQNDDDREKACRWAKGVPLGSRIEFKETKRTLPQNDLMWALLTEVAQQLEHGGRKYTPDEWKSIFLHAFGREISFLPSLDMKTFLPIELSSSDLSKDEMTNFIEFILKEGTERGVTFRDPNPQTTDAPSTSASDGDDASSPTAASSNEPEGTVPPPSGSSSSEPSLFGKFQFADGELVHLKDFARKSLDEATSDSDAPAKVQFVERMFLDYLDAVTSAEAKDALRAMGVPTHAVIDGKRTREQAAAYIAREILDCPAHDIEGRK